MQLKVVAVAEMLVYPFVANVVAVEYTTILATIAASSKSSKDDAVVASLVERVAAIATATTALPL